MRFALATEARLAALIIRNTRSPRLIVPPLGSATSSSAMRTIAAVGPS